jgi:hypothetical protein
MIGDDNMEYGKYLVFSGVILERFKISYIPNIFKHIIKFYIPFGTFEA